MREKSYRWGGHFGLLVFLIFFSSLAYGAIDEGILEMPYLQTATQEQFATEVESRSLPLKEWLRQLVDEKYNFICLGESHTKNHRTQLAEQVFPHLRLDHLLLETSQEQLLGLLEQEQQGAEVSLLGAPLSGLLRAVRIASPSSHIWGVEITPEQKAFSNLNPNKALARDGWITSNILKIYEPGKKTVALYGASHCAKNNVDSGWVRPFYSMLREALPETEKMITVKVIVAGGKVSYPLTTDQALLLYLKDTSLHGTSFVLPSLKEIPRESFNSKVEFLGLFESYDALAVLWLP